MSLRAHSTEQLRSLPSCLLFDVRPFALSSYGHVYEGLFVDSNEDRIVIAHCLRTYDTSSLRDG